MSLRTLQRITGFQVHLKYDKLPSPRQGDVAVVEFAMSMGLDKEDLMSMSRVKGNMTTADGRH